MEKQKNTNIKVLLFCLIAINAIFSLYSWSVHAHDDHLIGGDEEYQHNLDAENDQIDSEDMDILPQELMLEVRGCRKATSSQINTVNLGNQKRTDFLNACIGNTGSEAWCLQVERPNPSSKSIFDCTYGSQQPHRLIHPTSSTWKNAIKAIQLLQRLKTKGVCVSQIYNWWRPEPYNANVGGAAGRHPFGTSVDVRFCTSTDAKKGFDELCKYRRQGEVRALGYYGGTGVHIGVGDSTANTWGRSCQ